MRKNPDQIEPEIEDQEEINKRQMLIEGMANNLHEDWRAPRRIEDTDRFEPRWKAPKDAEFEKEWTERIQKGEKKNNVRLQDGKVELDIANTSYSELTEAWKAESKASAEISIGLVMDALKEGRLLNEDFVESASAVVHEKWVERNSWVKKDNPALARPYDELPEEEKEKDRIYVRRAIEACQSGIE